MSSVVQPLTLGGALASVRPGYEIPENDLVGEVLIPAMTASTSVDIGVGFFSSHCIAQIAPGLASLVARDVRCRLLVSPELSDEDRDAIERGITTPDEVIDRFLIDLVASSPSALASHVTDCLAYLVANGTLDIRCVLMQRGMFHKKVWIFAADVTAAVHGSGNLTARGLLVNGEQMTVDRPWMDGKSAATRVDDLVESYELEWANKKADRLTIVPSQFIQLLKDRHRSSSDVPTIDDFWESWKRDRDHGLAPELPPGVFGPPGAKLLRIPEWLDWHNPPYGHQSAAVAALRERDYVGLIALATGGGKTKTALIASTEIQDAHDGGLFVLILVPTSVLAGQWAEEVEDFGVRPIVLSGQSPDARGQLLEDVAIALRSGVARTEVAIATLQLYTGDEALRAAIENLASNHRSVLIADEAHNFGSAGILRHRPESFIHRIGLSATPVRQYDAEGTAELFEYFETDGDPAFTFTLGDAIRTGCLAPYRYHIHLATLTDAEMERYSDLTEQLVRAGFAAEDREEGLSERQERLLRERRALVEQADDKITVLRRLLQDRDDPPDHALIYCSAKAVLPPHAERQIDRVRDVLSDLRIDTHMFTSAETSRAGNRAYLEGFASGLYPVLLAMKVLDEGVDVPAAREAYLLASSTVEREWVQRRGRVLRRSPGKTHADLHDFVVLPADTSAPGARGLIQAELRRAQHFMDDADNKYDRDGPIDAIRSIEAQL